MKIFRGLVLILFVTSCFMLTSCDGDDNQPSGEFESGIFVINEGNFQDADGSISFINPDDGSVRHDLFGSVNNGLALGDVVQSMTVDGDFAYVVVNNSNKIEVVNANTFVSEHTIQGLSLPRYFTTLNGKGYVTEWVNYTDPGRVTVIYLENHSAGESITTGYGAENILAYDGLLYVSNNFSNTISVIDPAEEKVIKTIEVGSGPGTLLLDKEEMIWVICGGGYDTEFNPLNDGKLVRLDPEKSEDELAVSVVKAIELGTNLTAKAAINKAMDSLFYYSGNSVYALNTSANDASSSPLFTEADATVFYGIGFDPQNGMLYLSDTKNFAGNGVVYRYTSSGTPVDNKVAGRGPNGFVFR
jgi:YVTN family beta-propeller protein